METNIQSPNLSEAEIYFLTTEILKGFIFRERVGQKQSTLLKTKGKLSLT